MAQINTQYKIKISLITFDIQLIRKKQNNKVIYFKGFSPTANCKINLNHL